VCPRQLGTEICRGEVKGVTDCEEGHARTEREALEAFGLLPDAQQELLSQEQLWAASKAERLQAHSRAAALYEQVRASAPGA
jgi:hypothetical protein